MRCNAPDSLAGQVLHTGGALLIGPGVERLLTNVLYCTVQYRTTISGDDLIIVILGEWVWRFVGEEGTIVLDEVGGC